MFTIVQVDARDITEILGAEVAATLDLPAVATWVNARRAFDEADARHLVRFRVKTLAILAAGAGEVFDGLTVTSRSWSIEASRRAHADSRPELTSAQLYELLGSAESVTLSSDGRAASPAGWCKCTDVTEADWVQYERFTDEGRVAHGFVHRACRNLLQAG